MSLRAKVLNSYGNIDNILVTNSFKRFYSNVSVGYTGKEYYILLDKTKIITPLNNILSHSSVKLIQEIASEWSAQSEIIKIDSMPLTKLLFTAIDKVKPNIDNTILSLISAFETDFIIYQADHPLGIADKQKELFQPILLWIYDKYNIKPQINKSLYPLDNKSNVKFKLKELLDSFDFIELTSLQSLTNSINSLILAIAFLKKNINIKLLMECIYLEENWRIQITGDVDYLLEEKKILHFDINSVERFFDLKNYKE